MKNLMILAVLLSTMTFTACGQKNDIPTKVKTAFEQKFPNANKVSWDRENANEWEVEFKMDGKEYSANFDNYGNWKETEHEINTNDITIPVKTTLENDFSDYKIEEAEISETTKGKVFEFQLKNDNLYIEVAILPNGKLLKREEIVKEND